jgi:hypothetical protein
MEFARMNRRVCRLNMEKLGTFGNRLVFCAPYYLLGSLSRGGGVCTWRNISSIRGLPTSVSWESRRSFALAALGTAKSLLPPETRFMCRSCHPTHISSRWIL